MNVLTDFRQASAATSFRLATERLLTEFNPGWRTPAYLTPVRDVEPDYHLEPEQADVALAIVRGAIESGE